MHPRVLLCSAFFALATHSDALTANGKDAAQQLSAAMAEEIKAHPAKEGEVGYGRAAQNQNSLLR